MRVYAGIVAFFADGEYRAYVSISQKYGREMRDEIVQIAYHGEAFPTFGELFCLDAPEYARSAKTVAFRAVSQFGSVIPYVFMAEHSDCAAVGISRDDNFFISLVGDLFGENGLDLFPHAKKAAMGKPYRFSHAFVGFGGEIQIAFPVVGAFRTLKKQVERVAYASCCVTGGHARLAVGNGQT